MKKIDFIYSVIEKANVKKPAPVRVEKMVKDMSKAWQSQAEKFLETNTKEIDYKFVYSLILGGNCK